MNLDDQAYFCRRAVEEDKAARNASCRQSKSTPHGIGGTLPRSLQQPDNPPRISTDN